ncbi:MAG: histidine kinase [Verrucomicrobia bacterium]|nr:histidine kinase [Verrucomicrobiota bacterium]
MILRAAIVLWWIVFSLIAFAVSTIPPLILDRPVNLRSNLLWHSSWSIWCGLSFLAIYLARKFPIEGSALKKNLLFQFALGFAVVLLNVTIEFTITYATAMTSGNDFSKPLVFLASLFGYKFHINLIIYWAIIGATNAFEYYHRLRQNELVTTQLEAKLNQAELQALKMQLHPHFLFNTHHSIIALMLKQRNEEAIKMLTQLSDLLRITLEKTNQQFSSLKEELETLDLYLGIQAVRFSDRLKVISQVEAEALDAEVPFLILQPLVENAIRHGVARLSDGGQLTIAAQIQNNNLAIQITDNGPGLDRGHIPEESTGIGLKMTQSRLNQIYETRFELNMTSPTKDGPGTSVSIQIPYKKLTGVLRS